MSTCNSDQSLTNVADKVKAFNNLLSTSGSMPVYAFFFSETCGHCQTLMKYFLEYRNQCQTQKAKAVLVIINARTAPDLFKEYKIDVYPQIMVFKEKKRIKHIIGADTPALACAFRMAGIQINKKSREDMD